MNYTSWFEMEFRRLVEKYGGLINYHSHPDRAFIRDKKYFSIDVKDAPKLSLKQKQNLIELIHHNKNYRKDIKKNLIKLMNILCHFNTKKIYGFIDVAPSWNLDTINTALDVKKQFRNKIEFAVGAYPVMGLGNLNDEKYKLLAEAAELANFIGGLPERDDKKGCFGSFKHMKSLLELGNSLKKEVHIHVDQRNHPEEKMTEMLVDAVQETGSPKTGSDNLPSVWAIHSISPSCYNKKRLQRLINDLKRYNIGVICCPNAVSMLQLENHNAPIHNCVAPVLKLLANDVHVRFGSDNIEDYMVPSASADLSKDISYLAHLVRFYNVDVWARLCCGLNITKKQKSEILDYLKRCERFERQIVSDIKFQNQINKNKPRYQHDR